MKNEEKKLKFYENKNTGVTVEFNKDEQFVVKHGLKEMCPTTNKSFAIMYAKGYERGLAEGKKLK